jgi:hypothetical protein
MIPAYGFGDATTTDRGVFSFLPDDASCSGFTEVLDAYRRVVPLVKLSGPTTFAPIIYKAIDIVNSAGGQYNILIIVADGQVTRSVDLPPTSNSPHEEATIEAIVAASRVALSIIMVGVGDGPWQTMHEFDDRCECACVRACLRAYSTARAWVSHALYASAVANVVCVVLTMPSPLPPPPLTNPCRLPDRAFDNFQVCLGVRELLSLHGVAC